MSFSMSQVSDEDLSLSQIEGLHRENDQKKKKLALREIRLEREILEFQTSKLNRMTKKKLMMLKIEKKEEPEGVKREDRGCHGKRVVLVCDQLRWGLISLRRLRCGCLGSHGDKFALVSLR